MQDSRVHDRFETTQLVEFLGKDRDGVGRLENLSRSGAKVNSLVDCDLDIGSTLSVAMLDGTNLKGEIAWRRQNVFGLHFFPYLQDTMDHLYFDHLGADYYRRLLRLQSRASQVMASPTLSAPIETLKLQRD